MNFRQVSHGYDRAVNKGHGRIEIRQCWTLSDAEFLDYLPQRHSWKNPRTVVMLRAERRIGVKRSIETRYYLASVGNDAKLILRAVRGHWSIENGLEWVLDIAFREDENRVRQGHAAENFAVLRHIALNLLKQASSATVGKRRNDSKPLGIEITCSRFFPFEMRLPYIYAV